MVHYSLDIEDYNDLSVDESLQRRILNLTTGPSSKAVMTTPRLWNNPRTTKTPVTKRSTTTKKSSYTAVSNILEETVHQEQSHSTQHSASNNTASAQNNEIRTRLHELSNRYGRGRLKFQQEFSSTDMSKCKRISAKIKIPVLDDIYAAAEEQFQVKTRLELLEEDILGDVKSIINQRLSKEPEYGADDEPQYANRRKTSIMGADMWLRKSNTFDQGHIFQKPKDPKRTHSFKPEEEEIQPEKDPEPPQADTPTMQEHIAVRSS